MHLNTMLVDDYNLLRHATLLFCIIFVLRTAEFAYSCRIVPLFPVQRWCTRVRSRMQAWQSVSFVLLSLLPTRRNLVSVHFHGALFPNTLNQGVTPAIMAVNVNRGVELHSNVGVFQYFTHVFDWVSSSGTPQFVQKILHHTGMSMALKLDLAARIQLNSIASSGAAECSRAVILMCK